MNLNKTLRLFFSFFLPCLSLEATEKEWAPDYFIVGAQKSGTTAMEKFIDHHPLVSNRNREIHFFDVQFNKGVEWYRNQFLSRPSPNHLIGDKSPYYIFHPLVPQRIAGLYPKAKIIIVLRDPVDRAYSHYWMNVKDFRNEGLSFEEAIAAEESRLVGEVDKIIQNPTYHSKSHRNYSYLARGLYVQQIRRWLDYFPRDQILIIDSNHLRHETQKTMDGIFTFLELPTYIPKKDYQDKRSKYPAMDPATRAKLAMYFQPYNEELEELLDMKFNWNKS